MTTTPAFAEFYGAMLGDGCIYTHTNQIAITGNLISDKHYLTQYLAPLIEELFDIKPTIIFRKNTVLLLAGGKQLVEFLTQQGFPRGIKQNGTINIPETIQENPYLITHLLRGLLDTDGGVYAHPHTGIMLDITAKADNIREQLHTLLEQVFPTKKGFTSTGVVYYAENARRFLETIGTSNPRNSLRYQLYLKYGVVPSAKQTENLLSCYKCLFAEGLVV